MEFNNEGTCLRRKTVRQQLDMKMFREREELLEVIVLTYETMKLFGGESR